MTKALLAVTGAILLFAVTAVPAQAATTWSTGVHITPYPSQSSVDIDTGARWSKGECPDVAAASIRMKGDLVYVMDKCKDGLSAIGVWKDDKSGREYICRNSLGYREIVKCDFDWPERNGTFLAGVSKGTSVKYRDYGNMFLMNQKGDSCSPNPATLEC